MRDARPGKTADVGTARWVRVTAVLLAMLPALVGMSPAVASAAPVATGCPGAQVPPPPAAVEETAPGVVTPEPLPWPRHAPAS